MCNVHTLPKRGQSVYSALDHAKIVVYTFLARSKSTIQFRERLPLLVVGYEHVNQVDSRFTNSTVWRYL